MDFLKDGLVPISGLENGLEIVYSLRHSFAVATLGTGIVVGILVMLFAVRLAAKPHGSRQMKEL